MMFDRPSFNELAVDVVREVELYGGFDHAMRHYVKRDRRAIPAAACRLLAEEGIQLGGYE